MLFWSGKGEAPIVLVEYDVSEANFAQMPEKVRYKDIQKWIADEYDGMKVCSLYITQVKKLGLPKGKYGDNADRKHHLPQVTAKEEAAIMAAFKHFRML